VLGKLGGAFTTAGSSASAFLAILGKFAAAAAVIWLVVKVIDFLHTSQAEANEAISEATKKYAEEKEKLDELNGSLKTTSDRIEEL
jgi:large-conductance mechanosensitive channel